MSVGLFTIIYLVITIISLQFVLAHLAKNDWDKAPYFIFGNLLGSILWTLPLAIIMVLFTKVEIQYAPIQSIGGCDRTGTCAVLTAYGKVIAKRPVLGENVEVSREIKWSFE